MSKKNIYNPIFIIIFILHISFGNLYGQTRISSPYSRYGIGDIQNNIYPPSLSMGGVSYALKNPGSVNFSNPASYTGFDSCSFVSEIGISSMFNKLETTQFKNDDISNYTTLGHLLFGFPVIKIWSVSIGLLPFSNVGYKISDSEFIPDVGNVDYLYEGAGGINQFYIGNAFKIRENLSIGFNTSYLFGSLDKIRTVSIPDSANFFDVRIKNSIVPNDIYLNYGIQYSKILKNNFSINAGLVFSNSTKINSKENTIAERFVSTGYYEEIKDTLENSTGIKGNIVLPESIGIGILLSKEGKWKIGADYQWQNWSEYSSFGNKDSLKNSMRLGLGGEYTPDNSSVSKYMKKIHYRFGVRYSKTYLQLKNNQLNDYGISFGLGLPLRRSKKNINLGFEIGQRGTTNQNLIKENYGRIIINFAIYERWFFKRKYD